MSSHMYAINHHPLKLIIGMIFFIDYQFSVVHLVSFKYWL